MIKVVIQTKNYYRKEVNLQKQMVHYHKIIIHKHTLKLLYLFIVIVYLVKV